MDHFGTYAWLAYKAAHAEALRIAKDGIKVEEHGALNDLKDASGKAFVHPLKIPNLFKDKAGKDRTFTKEDHLRVAYFYDAFALHYLSDQFASGHTRCPRMELNRPEWMAAGNLWRSL